MAKEKKNPASEMSFLDHLEALRWHLIRSAVVIVVMLIVAFMNKSFVFDTVVFGPMRSDFISYRILCRMAEKFSLDLCITDFGFTLIATELAAQFTTHIWVSFIAALIVGFPYLAWELWRFVKPALTVKELKYTRGVVFFVTVLFISGVLFGYYLLAPLSINFLGTYQVSESVKNTITINSYISILTTLTLASGLVFQLPVVVFFLSKIGIITPKFMRTYRRHAMVVILIVAALITPSPDVSSQLLVATPLFLLYELSIFISGYVTRKQETAAI
jgi:sec-independent protein translocase protein TatC